MKKFGPGLLVMAAFIGPGTVTTASKAGASFGFALLWTVIFSVIAAIVLQQMAARLGLVTRMGLAEGLRSSIASPALSMLAAAMVVLAIGLGNAAYESGNIAGAAMGLNAIVALPDGVWAAVVGLTAFILLGSGRYKVVERGLIVLVGVMSLVFITTMVMVKSDLAALFSGTFKPSIPDGATLTVMALIGTTIVPYNLFLHASAVREKWPADYPLDQALQESRRDSVMAISLGGLITLAIMSTASAAFFGGDTEFSPATISQQLEPLLGSAAQYFFAVGLLAAGLTSAVTSPLAAAYAVCGAMGWPVDMADKRFKLVWMAVLGLGMLAAVLGARPISAIIFAQAANGFLLPIIAIFLLWVMNRKALLGGHVNRAASNILGGLVVAVVVGLGLLKIWSLIGQ